jgi:hypothetical protein
MAQPQQLAKVAHRQSLGGHLVSSKAKERGLPWVEICQRAGSPQRVCGLITITGIHDHDRPETLITLNRK